MPFSLINFEGWTFQVDKESTIETYNILKSGGSESCLCNDCKNYIANRNNAFPNEILNLFEELGVDYRKEVEITYWERSESGLHNIGGWFHFKGKIVSGKDCSIALPNGGSTLDLTDITANFKIGFTRKSDLTFFYNKENLVQIEFMTNIPWTLDDLQNS